MKQPQGDLNAFAGDGALAAKTDYVPVERARIQRTQRGPARGLVVAHAPLWLTIVFALWAAGSAVAAWLGARRHVDS